MDFTIQKCQDKGGLSAKPIKQINLDLLAIKQKFVTIVFTPYVLVVKKGVEVIVHRYGELIFKDTWDEAVVRKLAEEIYAAGIREKN